MFLYMKFKFYPLCEGLVRDGEIVKRLNYKLVNCLIPTNTFFRIYNLSILLSAVVKTTERIELDAK